jgi:hypothetical protein
MKKFPIDMTKLFPSAGAPDDFSKSLPADLVKYVVGEVGKGAPKGIDPKDAHLFIK